MPTAFPVELWFQVCSDVRTRVRWEEPHDTQAWKKTLEDLSLVSNAVRSTSQPLLFECFAVSNGTSRQRLEGIEKLFADRQESSTWIKQFMLKIEAHNQHLVSLVLPLVIRMTRLRLINISAPAIPHEMFTHILSSTQLRHLSYRTELLPIGFDESTPADAKPQITTLVISDLARLDNQVLARLSSSVEDLEITGIAPPPPGNFFNSNDHRLLPQLQTLRAVVAMAVALVPSRPVRTLFVRYPDDFQPIDLETISTISRGSTPMGSLYIEGGSLSDARDLLVQVAVHLPALTALSLCLAKIPTYSLHAYLRDPTCALPSQLRRFNSFSDMETVGKLVPGIGFYDSISRLYPSLEYIVAQTNDVWTKQGGLEKNGRFR